MRVDYSSLPYLPTLSLHGFALADILLQIWHTMYSRIVHHYNLISATFSRKLLSGAKLVIFLHIYKEKGRKFFDNLHFVKSGVKFSVSFGT